MGLIDVYRINPADQFSVFSPSLKKTQEITYYTLLAKIRGDLNITGTSGNVDNWNQAYDQTIMSGVVTGYTTKTITLTRRDGTEISFDFQDLSPASEDTLDMVTTRGNSTVNTINVGGVTSDYLLFDTAATPTLEVGMMAWNAQDGTADLRLMGNNVTLQIGQEQVVRVVNKTGSDLLEANYQAVKITGAQGNRLKIGLARADSDANSADTIGIVTETINDNQEGFVTSSGLVRSIDTTGSLQSETWADGDVLYLSPITFGQLTNIKPLAPQHTVIVGFVVRAHQTQGQIYVKVDNGYEIDELHNVRITSVTNNQILKYNSSLQVWQNVDISTLATTLAFSTIAVAGQSSIVAEAIQDTLNIASGTGISLTTDASTDTLTITNSAPDQIVSLTAGSNVTITGTYPSFTIAATDQYSGTVTSVNLTAGSGMAVAGGPITTSGSITVTNIDKGSDQNIFKNVAVTGQGTIVADSNNDTLTVDPGTGISLTTNATTDTLTITNTAPDQVVSIAAGTGISTSGTYPSFTVTNTAPDQTVVLTGTGTTTITGTYPNFTINSDDQYDGTVTSVNLIASTGISVSGGPITTSGSITVTNTAPDQVVVLNAGTGISTSGTYPNFTVTNTAPDQVVSITAGTGMSVSGTYPSFTVTNTAPDQVVSITGAGTSVVTGTYPNFTITSNDQYVGTVTSVNLTAGTGITVSGGPITSSGSITVNNSDRGSSQNIFKNIAVPGQTTIVASTNNDTFTIKPGSGMSATTLGNDITLSNTDPGSSQNIFKNIAVAGQNTIVADSNNDTLSFVAGTGISLTTNDTTDSLTVTNSAPDQVVALSSGTGISVSGTYPNFTITNTSPSSGGTVTGTGTTNYVTKWTTSSNIGDSQIFDNGTNVGIGTAIPANKLHVSGTGQFGDYALIGTSISAGFFMDTWNGAFRANGTSGTKGFYFQSYNGANSYMYVGLNGAYAGNVGIGTTSPSQRLDISQGSIFLSGSGSKYLYIRRYDGLGTHSFGVGSDEKLILSLSGSNPFIVNGGNVGIGTTAPATLLHISGTGNTFTRYTNTTNAGHFMDVGSNSSGQHFIFGYGAYPMLFGTNGSEVMRITSGGNVGIGTTSPAALLHLNKQTGVTSFTSTTFLQQVISEPNGQGTEYVGLDFTGYNSGFSARPLARIAMIPTGAGSVLSFGTSNSYGTGITNQALTILHNANVGIGTTSPTKKLQIAISDSAHADEGILLQSPSGYGEGAIYHDYGQSNGTTAFKIWNTYTGSQIALSQDSYSSTGSPGSIRFYTSAQGTANVPSERLRITSTGNVGIGTTSPGYKLEVNGTGRFNGELTVVPSSTNGVTVSRAGGYASIYGSNDLVFETDNVFYFGVYTPRLFSVNSSFYTTAGGNVGIGTASPAGYAGRILDIGGASTVSLNFHTTTSGSTQNDGATLYYGSDNSLRIVNYESDGIVRIDTQDTERMRITSGGNVGIGTTSPGQKLDVNGNVVATSFGGRVYPYNSILGSGADASTGTVFAGSTNGYVSSIDVAGGGASNPNTIIIKTASAERMRITSDGNVGIGTTSPTIQAGFKQLSISAGVSGDVRGALNIQGARTADSTFASLAFYHKTNYVAGIESSRGGADNSGSLEFYTSNAGTLAERIRVTPAGNVGIGTTSPYSPFQVGAYTATGGYARGSVATLAGAWSATLPTLALISTDNTSTQNKGGGIGFGSGSEAGSSPYIYAQIKGLKELTGATYSGYLAFYTTPSGSDANTERMRINSAGNVGIGTTSPSNKLTIVSSAQNSGLSIFDFNGAGGWGGGISLGVSGLSLETQGKIYTSLTNGGPGTVAGDMRFQTANSGALSDKMTITAAGNVGIGTTSPSSLLEIAGASPVLTINRTSGTSSTINFNSSGSNFASIISNPSNGENRFSIGPAAAWGGFHTFYTDTSERMRITAAGNVGIGTTAPNERLHVAGRIMASGSGYTLNPTAPIFGQYAATRGYVQVPTNGQFEIWNGATAEIATFYENRNSVFYGNVGIGTTSPGGKLEVNHTGAQGATSLILRTSDFSTANGTIRWQNNVGTNQAGIGSNYTTSDTGALEFLNGNTCNLIIRSSGNVGIGTTSPQGPLEIYKSNAGGLGGHIILNNNGSSVGNETAILFNDSGIGSASYVRAAISSTVEGSPYAGDIKFKTGISAYASLSTQMIIKGNGNVGIGTTSPTYKFNVVSNAVAGKQNLAAIDRTAQNFVTFTNPQYSTDASMGLLLRVFPQSDARQGAGIIASGGSNNATTDLDLFVTTSPDGLGGTSYSAVKINGLNGNVGIGTTSPGYKLDVNGSARVNNTLWVNNSNGTAVINAYSGGQIGTYLAKSSSATANFTTTGVSYPRGLGFGAIIGQGNTTDIPVNNASWNGGYGGNIGFWSDVHYGVEGGTNSIGFNAVIKGSGNSNSYGFFSDLSGATDGTRYGIYTKGEQQNYFSGNVGIGTTSPSNKLTVRGSGAIAALQTTAATGQNWLDFQDSAGASKGYVGYGSSGTNDLYLTQLSASSNIAFYNGGSIRLVINSSGNVGIGTTSPSQKLHVVGSRILVQDGSNAGLMINTGGVDRYSVASTSGAFQIYDEVALTNRFYITSTGNVGIGTTSPGSKLTVIGDIATSTRVASDTINGYTGGSTPLTIQTGGAQNLIIGTNNTERIRVTAAGDVGIGTTSPSAPLTIVSQVNNGSAILTIRSSDNFGYSFARSNTTGFLEFDGNQTGNIGYVFKNGNVGIGTTSPASRLHVETSSSNPFRMVRTGGSATNFGYEFGSGAIGLYDYTNSTYRYYITSGGNVGIGTTSPVASLDVRGAGNAVHLQSTSNDVWQTFKPQTGNTWRIQAQTSNNFGIYDENASSFRFLINSSGNVGIGTTSPLFNLQVGANSGTIATTTIRLQNSYLDSNGYYGFNIDAVDNGVNGHDLRFLGRTSPTGAFSEVVRIKNSGNVGIGTTSPGASLHVAGAINSTPTGDGFLAGIQSGYAVIHLNGSAATGSLIDFSVSGTDTKGRILYDNINNYFGFNTNGAERLKITSTGDVGIGTSSPSAKLHVIGNATVSATLSTVNAKITGTLTDYLNQPGTAGQILSSTGTGIEWITGGGGGGGSTIIVKDQGTTIGSSFTTLDFIGDNVNATASGSTAVIEVTGRASSGSIYYEAVTTPFVIPGFGFVNVEIDTQIVQATAPASLTGSNKLIATVTFGVRNVSLFEGFNGFKFRLYNFPQTSAVPNTTHNWTAYMSKDEFCDTTQFTFHIPIDPSVVSAGDDIRVQADALTNYTPEIYYCALTLMEGTA